VKNEPGGKYWTIQLMKSTTKQFFLKLLSLKIYKKMRQLSWQRPKVTQRKARKGRNPQTGEEIYIKASKAPKFTPGKALKEAVK